MSELLTAIGVVVGLMGLGGLLVWWPLSLKLKILREENERLHDATQKAVESVELERSIDDARDLEPADELRVLLDPHASDEPHAAGGPED